MKRFRNILSSGSVSDEPSSPTVSQTKKMPQMDTGDGSGRQEELPEEVSLKDVYVQLNNLKRILNQNLDALTSRIDEVCNELKSEVKILKEHVVDLDKSLENAWVEIDEIKSNMASNETEVTELRNEVQALKEKLREEKQRNIRLEQYTRRENLRLLNVPEREDEETEELFIEVLKEMGVYHENIRFHDVHRVPRNRRMGSNGGGKTDKENPRHIIARFVVRKERDLVWENRDKIKNCPRFKDSFFVPDLAKELAEESFILRQAVRIARERELRVEIRRNKLVMLDSGLSYAASEVPQYLRKKK